MKRYQIVKKVRANQAKIKAIEQTNIALNRMQLMMSDSKQWYTESEETYGSGKSKETALMGFVHWKEYFLDEDTGRKICIARKHPVRKNNEWINGY